MTAWVRIQAKWAAEILLCNHTVLHWREIVQCLPIWLTCIAWLYLFWPLIHDSFESVINRMCDMWKCRNVLNYWICNGKTFPIGWWAFSSIHPFIFNPNSQLNMVHRKTRKYSRVFANFSIYQYDGAVFSLFFLSLMIALQSELWKKNAECFSPESSKSLPETLQNCSLSAVKLFIHPVSCFLLYNLSLFVFSHIFSISRSFIVFDKIKCEQRAL